MSYRVGLVGARRGSSLVRPFELFPETEITALCDLDGKRLGDVAQALEVPDEQLYTNYDDFVQRAPVDIVVVGTPIPFHAEQAIKAMEAGKHVLSEVTAAYTLEDCQRLVDAVKRTGQTYMLAENQCYLHYIREWDSWIKAGRLGQIHYAEAEYIHNIEHLLIDPNSGEAFWRLQRPPIYYCSHSLGPLLMLMDDRVVAASCLHTGYGTMENLGPGCLNMEVALFKTAKGAAIKVLRSQVARREPPLHYYVLYGTKGTVENDRVGGHGDGGKGKLFVQGEHSAQAGFVEIDCPTSDPAAPPEARSGGHGTTEYYLVREFIDALNAGRRPALDVIKGVEMTAPGICAHESAMQGGKWIDVPQFGW